jgi:hypothetical protein
MASSSWRSHGRSFRRHASVRRRWLPATRKRIGATVGLRGFFETSVIRWVFMKTPSDVGKQNGPVQ